MDACALVDVSVKATDILAAVLTSPTRCMLPVVVDNIVTYPSFHSTIIALVPRTSPHTCTLHTTADQVTIITMMMMMMMTAAAAAAAVVAAAAAADDDDVGYVTLDDTSTPRCRVDASTRRNITHSYLTLL